jgi:hypothetical protein
VGAALPATAAGSGEFGLEETGASRPGAVTSQVRENPGGDADGGPLEWGSWGYNAARATNSGLR